MNKLPKKYIVRDLYKEPVPKGRKVILDYGYRVIKIKKRIKLKDLYIFANEVYTKNNYNRNSFPFAGIPRYNNAAYVYCTKVDGWYFHGARTHKMIMDGCFWTNVESGWWYANVKTNPAFIKDKDLRIYYKTRSAWYKFTHQKPDLAINEVILVHKDDEVTFALVDETDGTIIDDYHVSNIKGYSFFVPLTDYKVNGPIKIEKDKKLPKRKILFIW